MSNLDNWYRKLKNEDSTKYYLFKSGAFLIFLDDDAKEVSRLLNLKLTRLNKNILKCGFPIKGSEKYFLMFSDLDIFYEVIEDNNIRNILDKIDIDNMTPNICLNIIVYLKEMISNE